MMKFIRVCVESENGYTCCFEILLDEIAAFDSLNVIIGDHVDHAVNIILRCLLDEPTAVPRRHMQEILHADEACSQCTQRVFLNMVADVCVSAHCKIH